MQNKNKKKPAPKKASAANNKQSNNPNEASTGLRKNDSNGSKSNEKTPATSAYNRRSYNSGSNVGYTSGVANTLGGASGSISAGSSSVYGYGGLPIAPPPNGNSGNFVTTHIPPAQRAGPYIPYFPQAIKPS